MTRICIQIDECKPHWAEERGYRGVAETCGLKNILVGGDFDNKTACIYGDVEDFEAFSALISNSPLREGSLFKVSATAKDTPPKEPAILSEEWNRRMTKANDELAEVREINRQNGWGS